MDENHWNKLAKKFSKTNLLKKDDGDTWETAYLCKHYRRKCLIQPPCCPGKFYACRICHDDIADHHIGVHRYEITTIKCGMCQTVQNVSNQCVNANCGIQFATYFCAECRLWSTSTIHEKKDIYHCAGCKLCRNGKREDWKHCDACCVCYAVDHFDEHICVPRKIERNCPVCKQFMFDARDQVLFLGCGHPVHEGCLDTLFRDWKMYRCFTCRVLMLRIPEDAVERNERGEVLEVETQWPRLRVSVSKDYPIWRPPSPQPILPTTRKRQKRTKTSGEERKTNDSSTPKWGDMALKCMECQKRFPSCEDLIAHSKEKHSPEAKATQAALLKNRCKPKPRELHGP